MRHAFPECEWYALAHPQHGTVRIGVVAVKDRTVVFSTTWVEWVGCWWPPIEARVREERWEFASLAFRYARSYINMLIRRDGPTAR